MFSHITLGTNDWQKARPFWVALMECLEIPIFFELENRISFGTPTGPKIFIGDAFNGEPASFGNGTHVAFLAQSHLQVDAFYALALKHGGTDEGKPGLRPHYHPNYYGAYVRDPDGNKLQAVCHSSKA